MYVPKLKKKIVHYTYIFLFYRVFSIHIGDTMESFLSVAGNALGWSILRVRGNVISWITSFVALQCKIIHYILKHSLGHKFLGKGYK